MGPASDSFLLTNKFAVRTGIKLSISVWGGLVIGLLMNFEHPVWVMITGIISFFGLDHAQVLKKCLAQTFATIVGGLIGVVIMSFTMQSPFLTVMTVSILLFIGSGLGYNTRDMNLTFCCAFTCLTICLMVIVPVLVGPTPETLMTIFIDRVGTVTFGIFWVAFVSICFWPMYSADMLKGSTKQLIDTLTEEINPGKDHQQSLLKISSLVAQIEDTAKNSDFESHNSRNAARIARKINELVFSIFGESVFLLENRNNISDSIKACFEDYLALLKHKHHAFHAINEEHDDLVRQGNELKARVANLDSEILTPLDFIFVDKLRSCIDNFIAMKELQNNLFHDRRFYNNTIKITKTFDIKNFIRNGARTSGYFILAYAFWYVTSWSYSFLIVAVPIVFSVMFSRLPHAEILLGKVIKGMLFSIPVGVIVYIITANAPSAIELYILIAGIPLFFGLMGLSSLSSFALSVGFNIGYLVTILPENNYDYTLDVSFAIVRTLAIAIGVIILQQLFVLIPRDTLLGSFGSGKKLFSNELNDALDIDKNGRSEAIEKINARIVDKLTTASMQEVDETRKDVILEGNRALEVNRAIRALSRHAKLADLPNSFFKNINEWKKDILARKQFEDDDSKKLHAIVKENALSSGLSMMDNKMFFIENVIPEYDRLIRNSIKQ
ncbi:FUSC family protein [Rouxiella badensis]|uniref:FUSC family protein n=1 Tax=Rouxiella badensis TaxID=1646377 RepID=UPI0013EF0CF9|nr:FUSC family protein [Rouxiella badensis]MCC3721335.1 FUSC family protein [Rouxiella badensis]MCC3735279.1 FUSC family protein [Rouxiella badensis]MCC3760576.1 FUSC family protein [Rouxiella badensis]QII38215.1 FUSC family protein [Rouxiella badensis]WAT09630.1 FUSC family protein [Rouxiella badensis]